MKGNLYQFLIFGLLFMVGVFGVVSLVSRTKDYESNLKTYYERYKQAGIINSYKFMDTSEFNNFVLTTFDN